jgi:acyl-coenzyme A synthetase/AMP-(fatty) acid ligase
LKPKDYEQKPERYKSVGKAIGNDCMIYNIDEERVCKADEEGFLYLTSLSNVLDVAVIKVVDNDLGEVPRAFIQTVDGNELSDE